MRRERFLAKFWLEPVSLASSTGFRPHELAELRRMVTENEADFLEAWHGFFES